MKMLAPLVVCVLGMSALASPAVGGARRFDVKDAAAVRALFERFEREHGRRYADPRERRSRLAVFMDNLARINQLNEDDPHAEYGITKFTDLSPEEYIQKYTGYKHNPRKTNVFCENVTTVPDVDAPDSFDWREHGAVALPKDQANCGSCWAFAVIANVEGQYAIKHKKLVTFSEQQLVSCDKYDDGCDGGFEITAIPALIEMGGVQTNDDYPYVSGENWTVPECKMDKNKFKAKVIGCKEFYHEKVTEDDIKRHLYSNGPLTIDIDPTALLHYRNGVITNCEGTSIRHAVVLVGYGTTDDGVPYWIVRDHSGSDTGENGYFRMKRGVNCLGFVHEARMIMSSVVE